MSEPNNLRATLLAALACCLLPPGAGAAPCTAADGTPEAPACNAGTVLKSGSITTPAGVEDRAKLCSAAGAFPKQWEWAPDQVRHQPRAATEDDHLTPKVEQYRHGKLVAIYDYLGGGKQWGCYGENFSAKLDGIAAGGGAPIHVQGCGPFWVTHQMRAFADGDVFKVYPAVYTGAENAVVLSASTSNGAEFSAAMLAHNAWVAQYGAVRDAAAYHPGHPTLDVQGIPRPPPFGTPMRNVTIQGVTVNGVRPVIKVSAAAGGGGAGVFIGENTGTRAPGSVQNLTIENIDVVSGGVSFLDAGIKIQSADGVTFRNMRIAGFRAPGTGGMQGITTRDGIAGFLRFDGVIFDRNGGIQRNGTDAHNLYLGPSIWDKNYRVEMVHSWSHDAYWGHAFKSRAQTNILIGNYFSGGTGDEGYPGESYLVDISNGGKLVFKDNILVKNASGDGTNGTALAYAMEQVIDGRDSSVDIENNTFVAFAKYWDTKHHQTVPMIFGWPFVTPDARQGLVGLKLQKASGESVPLTVGAADVTVARNVFVGFCPADDRAFAAPFDYRGALAVNAGFADLAPDFSLKTKVSAEDTSIVGQPAYTHAAQPGAQRTQPTIGARD